MNFNLITRTNLLDVDSHSAAEFLCVVVDFKRDWCKRAGCFAFDADSRVYDHKLFVNDFSERDQFRHSDEYIGSCRHFEQFVLTNIDRNIFFRRVYRVEASLSRELSCRLDESVTLQVEVHAPRHHCTNNVCVYDTELDSIQQKPCRIRQELHFVSFVRRQRRLWKRMQTCYVVYRRNQSLYCINANDIR